MFSFFIPWFKKAGEEAPMHVPAYDGVAAAIIFVVFVLFIAVMVFRTFYEDRRKPK